LTGLRAVICIALILKQTWNASSLFMYQRHPKIYYVNIGGVPTACVIFDTWIRTVKSHLIEFRDESELDAATSPTICKSMSQPVTELEQRLLSTQFLIWHSSCSHKLRPTVEPFQ
jgi:hypothetical protein